MDSIPFHPDRIFFEGAPHEQIIFPNSFGCQFSILAHLQFLPVTWENPYPSLDRTPIEQEWDKDTILIDTLNLI
jgi:hypothetical protein